VQARGPPEGDAVLGGPVQFEPLTRPRKALVSQKDLWADFVLLNALMDKIPAMLMMMMMCAESVLVRLLSDGARVMALWGR